MSEDRTQPASKQRQQQAREQGFVAHSPELTGASALFAASLMLGFVGESIAAGLIGLIRDSWTGEVILSLTSDAFCARMNQAAMRIGPSFVGLILFPAVAAIGAHQAQVRGLFVPSLIAPDPTRLWGGGGGGFGARLMKGGWTLFKTIILIGLTVWAMKSKSEQLIGLGGMDASVLGRSWATALGRMTTTLATAALALGLIDYYMQFRRFESLLMMTPDQSREDRKSAEGDPALRSKRMRIAKSWRGDAPELLAGVTLAVKGNGNLIVVLSGGPPPKRVNIRSSAKGATGLRLSKAVDRSKIASIENHALARKLALVRLPTLPPELASELKAAWPV